MNAIIKNTADIINYIFHLRHPDVLSVIAENKTNSTSKTSIIY